MSTETPKEKAERLKVKLFATPPPKYMNPDTKPRDESFKQSLGQLLEQVVGICETCSREIKVRDSQHPCGKVSCPFGELSM